VKTKTSLVLSNK